MGAGPLRPAVRAGLGTNALRPSPLALGYISLINLHVLCHFEIPMPVSIKFLTLLGDFQWEIQEMMRNSTRLIGRIVTWPQASRIQKDAQSRLIFGQQP